MLIIGLFLLDFGGFLKFMYVHTQLRMYCTLVTIKIK